MGSVKFLYASILMREKNMKNSPLSSMKTFGSASQVSAIRDIVEDPRECIEDWIDKAHWAFANGESFFVDLQRSC